MASRFEEIQIILGLKKEGFDKGLLGSQKALKKFSSSFNQDFIAGMTKGSATTKDFGAQLLKTGSQVGLSTAQLSKMSGATGIFSKQQLAAGKASATMARKAKIVSEALKRGKITAEEAGKAYGKLAKEHEVAGKSSKLLSANMLKTAAVIGGVVVGIMAAGKALYDIGKRGAIVTQTAESFEFLSEKLGLAPDLLDQLRIASKGTITDMKLMSSTATLLAGTTDEVGRAMGDATPQLMEIAKAANKLNPSLGTTAYMYESLSLGIKRQSPLILDNLGLTIKIGAASKAYAKQIGKTVEQLTAEEKQIALLNATLAAGDNLIAQVGGTTDSAVDSFAQAETAVANLKDGLSELVYVGIAPAVSGFAGLVQGALDNRDAYAELKSAMDAGLITLDEHNQLQWDMIDGIKTTSEVMDVLAQKEIIQEAQLRSVGGSADYLAVRFTSLGNLAQEAMGEVTGAIDGTTSAQDLLNIALKTYNERLLFNLASEHLSTEASMELAYQMGLVDEKTVSAYKSIDILTGKYELNEDGIINNIEASDDFIDTILRMRPRLADLKNDLGGAAGEAARLGRNIRGLKGKTIVVKTKFVVTGQHPGYGGIQKYQHGGSFIVPPGFPSDSYPMLVSSGERVTIQRKDQIGSSMMQGVSKGVRGEYEDAAMDTMRAMQGLIGTAEKTLGISSPSAMFYDIGLAMMKGLERGIERGKRGVDDALSLVMKGMKETAKSGMNDIGDVTRTGMDYITKAVQDGTDESTSIWNWHMQDVEDITRTGMDYVTKATQDGMGDMGDITRTGMDYVTRAVQDGSDESTSIWNWHMQGMGDITRTGMDHVVRNTREGASQVAVTLDQSLANMRAYWANAQSIFGGTSPYSGQLPDWPTAPPPTPYVPPPAPPYEGSPYTDEGVPDFTYPGVPPPGADVPYSDLPPSLPSDVDYYNPPPPPPKLDPEDPYTHYPPKPTSVQNILNIYTNAPVESDVPDLLLLRAWASG